MLATLGICIKIEKLSAGKMCIYTHIRVAHLRIRIHEMAHCHRLEQVAFLVDVALVLVSAV